MKNTEIKWNQREICEILNGQLVTFHASLEAAMRDKTPETNILVCSKEDALKLPVFELNDPEVCYE